jgi:hypothetical protein
MSPDYRSFRVQVRFNKVEDAELFQDLKQYSDSFERAGRIRFLLRSGLKATQSALVPGPINGMSSAVLGNENKSAGEASATLTRGKDLEAFMANGFDITNFAFTGESSI